MEVDIEREEEKGKRKTGENIEKAGWALFLIMIGALWMAPDGTFPDGSWLIGSGAIILLVQLIRSLAGLAVSGGTLIFGLLALGLGFGDMIDFDIPIFPAILILVGLYMLYEVLLKKRD